MDTETENPTKKLMDEYHSIRDYLLRADAALYQGLRQLERKNDDDAPMVSMIKENEMLLRRTLEWTKNIMDLWLEENEKSLKSLQEFVRRWTPYLLEVEKDYRKRVGQIEP